MKAINTALCSYGMSGRLFHAPFIHLHPGYHLNGVLERTKNLSKEKYPDVIIFRSLNDVLADDTIDMVIINTPNYTHYDYAKQSLLAGKHVVVEKPFTNTVAEALELTDIAKTKQLTLSVFQNRRYDSDFRTVQQIVHQHVLGDIVDVEIHFDRYKPALNPKQHKEAPGQGTGLLYDLGPHVTDQALTLFGMPRAVFADIRTNRPQSLIDDYFEVLLYYPTKRVKVKSSLYVAEALPAFILHGTKGSFLKTRADVQEDMLQAGITPDMPGYGIEPAQQQGLLHTIADGISTITNVATQPGNYSGYYEDVYQAVTQGKPVPVSGQDGVNIMRIIEAAYQSSREKKVIVL